MSVSDQELFETTYLKYGAKLYRFCFVQLGNIHDAEDAVQEVFIKRLYNAPVFKSQEHEKNWIYQVAVNICKDKLKKKGRLDLPIEYAENIGSKDEESLLPAVLSMPEKLRTVIHLHYYEGYGVREIAKTLGITESAVKMRLKRGREMLRAELEDEQ